MIAEAEVVAHLIIAAFDKVGIEYAVGGSVASTSYGIPRLTADVDIVAEISHEQIAVLVAEMSSEFYIDGDMISVALQNASEEGGVFNVIHLRTMVKGDIFVKQATPFYQSEWERRQKRKIVLDSPNPPVFIASPEDMILQKLKWYRMTGERSDNQWGDVLGMLKVQADNLDKTYLRHWAVQLNLSDLLIQAAQEAGLNPSN